ncbi:MAG: dephospho-CoA kinase [Deltaproteobacteria bacterium]|nr:dephospho-CoA kinase [Deltaproteobacteria bacterium]
MKTIGLTGGIATGKSTVARILRDELGVPVIDADQVAREIVAPGQPALAEIAARFGPSVLLADGALDRRALGALVMGDPLARQALDGITHPRIRAAIQHHLRRLADEGAPAAAVEAALLVETGAYKLYDALLVVSCAPTTQLQRLMSREKMSEDEARRWVQSQLPLAEKERLGTVVIYNDGDGDTLRAAVRAAWDTLSS